MGNLPGPHPPPEIHGAFNPNDKTNLALYRLLHFVVFAFFVVRLLPRDWPGLEWRIFRPAIKCGQQSLEVFCSGIFLSFAAHFVLVEISGAIWMQIVVSIVGILMMTALRSSRLSRRQVERRRLSASTRKGEVTKHGRRGTPWRRRCRCVEQPPDCFEHSSFCSAEDRGND